MNFSKNYSKHLIITLAFLLVFSFSLKLDAEMRTVTDMVGRKVEIPEKVERVVTTYTPATQFVMALGADDKLVSGSSGMPKQKIFKLVNPEVKDLPSVGSKNKGVNIESIMELDPDLVIMFPHGDGVNTANKLQELGIPTIVINPESFEEIRKTNQLLGEALNKEKQAKIIDKQYEKMLKLAKRTEDIPEEEKKVVYFANSELLDTVGKNMLQTDLIEMVAGINPAKDVKQGFVKINPEQLIKWNPNAVIVSQFYRGDIDKLIETEKYQSIKAFDYKAVYRIPSQLEPWDYPSPSSVLIIPWLGKILYTDIYNDISFRGVVNDFYNDVYGKTYNEFTGELE